MSPAPRRAVLLLRRRHEVRRQRRAFAEEELLALFAEDLVRLHAGEIEAVLVDDHLRVLQPHLPCFQGDLVVDAFAEFVIERFVRHRRKLFLELGAFDCATHGGQSSKFLCGTQASPSYWGVSRRIRPIAGVPCGAVSRNALRSFRTTMDATRGLSGAWPARTLCKVSASVSFKSSLTM